jgi:hypothetical protein
MRLLVGCVGHERTALAVGDGRCQPDGRRCVGGKSDKGFERHKQPWTLDELEKLKRLAVKGMGLKAIAKALTRSEESTQAKAKEIGLKIAKLR